MAAIYIYIYIYIYIFKTSHYRNVTTGPVGTDHGSQAICGTHFGNSWSILTVWPKFIPS